MRNIFKELHIIIYLKKNICNISLSESEEYDIRWILSMYGLFRG